MSQERRPAGTTPPKCFAPGPLPEVGSGAAEAIDELVAGGIPAATRSAGPRFFHFVTGRVTPAALGADWLTSALDQNSFSWVSSPLGSRAELVAGGRQRYRPSSGDRGSEMSRRARSLAVWATLRAYGRAGYRELVDRHIRLAQRVGEQMAADPELELLAPCS